MRRPSSSAVPKPSEWRSARRRERAAAVGAAQLRRPRRLVARNASFHPPDHRSWLPRRPAFRIFASTLWNSTRHVHAGRRVIAARGNHGIDLPRARQLGSARPEFRERRVCSATAPCSRRSIAFTSTAASPWRARWRSRSSSRSFPSASFSARLPAFSAAANWPRRPSSSCSRSCRNGVAGALAPQVEAIMGHTRIDLLTVERRAVAVLCHERHRDPARGAQRRLSRQRDAPVSPMPRPQHAVRLRERGLDAGADLGGGRGPRDRRALRSRRSRMRSSLMRSPGSAPSLRYASAAPSSARSCSRSTCGSLRGSGASRTSGPACCCRWCCGCSAASLYSYYLDLSDYSRFYAGLSQLMVALIFFQMTAVIVILGAELNRGILELKRMSAPTGSTRSPPCRPCRALGRSFIDRARRRPDRAVGAQLEPSALAHLLAGLDARPR